MVDGNSLCTRYCLMIDCCEIAVEIMTVIWRIISNHVTAISIIFRFIDCHPKLYTISKGFKADPRIGCKCVNDCTIFPAAFIRYGLWKIIVKQRNIGLNLLSQTIINHPVIEINPLLIDLPCSLRQNSCPGNREPVGILSSCLEHINIFLVMVIKITGYISGGTIDI